jgi:uncharacterized membrane protein
MTPVPAALAWTRRLETASALDPLVRTVRPLAELFVAEPTRRDLLRGAWLGHPLHPVLTDLPIGLWTSAVTLDLVGGRSARPAATRLVGLGLLSAGPTAWSGWADWTALDEPGQRVGVVHAITNGVAVALFASSWLARHRGAHGRGRTLGLAGATVLTVGGYLGGHLVAHRAQLPQPQPQPPPQP